MRGRRNERRETTQGAVTLWRDMFLPVIDDAQLAIDRQHLASEVHMLLRLE
jgi:hypothetical protein